MELFQINYLHLFYIRQLNELFRFIKRQLLETKKLEKKIIRIFFLKSMEFWISENLNYKGITLDYQIDTLERTQFIAFSRDSLGVILTCKTFVLNYEWLEYIHS